MCAEKEEVWKSPRVNTYSTDKNNVIFLTENTQIIRDWNMLG